MNAKLKSVLTFSLVIAFLMAFFVNIGFAQQKASNAVAEIKSLDQSNLVILSKQDNALLLEREKSMRAPDRPMHFAVPLQTRLDVVRQAQWSEEGKMSVGRLEIESREAYTLNFAFQGFFLPPSAELRLIGPEQGDVKGPFTGAQYNLYDEFWSPIVRGDRVMIELRVATSERAELRLYLASVQHDFVGFLGTARSGSCNVDVACGEEDGFPEIEAWRQQIQSVGAYHINGIATCSGALVNNTEGDCTPYFLTADHCGISPNNAGSLVVYWNYQNSECRPPFSADSGRPGDGRLDDFNTGAILRANSEATDFALIELRDPVAAASNAYFSGISAEMGVGGKSVCIHHPGVEEKRITFDLNDAVISPGGNNYIRINNWEVGTTEGGSSGSPLYNEEQLIVGQLFGGSASCTSITEDIYGRVSISWNGANTPSTQLKNWLDPTNSGALKINGKWCRTGIVSEIKEIQLCSSDTQAYTIPVIAQGDFSGPISFTVSNDLAGVQVQLSSTEVMVGDTIVMTVSNFQDLASGVYSIRLTGSDGVEEAFYTLRLIVTAGIPNQVSLQLPANGSNGVRSGDLLVWNAQTDATYEIQISKAPDFGTLAFPTFETANNTLTLENLESLVTFYWRVRAVNRCGFSEEWSTVYRFSTSSERCISFVSSDGPKTINDEVPNLITSTINITDDQEINRINLRNINGTHSYVGDLVFSLTGPDGTRALLLSRACGSAADFDMGFSDQSTTGIVCPLSQGLVYSPTQSLSIFQGKQTAGDWVLGIDDRAFGDGGTFRSWALEVCFDAGGEVTSDREIVELCATSDEQVLVPLYVGAGFLDTIDIELEHNLAGASVNISSVTAFSGDTIFLSIDQFNMLSAGNYDITVRFNNGDNSIILSLPVIVSSEIPSVVIPSLPANGMRNVPTTQVALVWEAIEGASYELELSILSDFSTLVQPTIQTDLAEYIISGLSTGTTYYWRVRAMNSCGFSPEWSEVFEFTTVTIRCVTADGAGLPLEIVTSGPNTVSSTVAIDQEGLILSARVLNIRGTHSYVGDLTFTLISPAGVEISLLSEECGDSDDFNLSFSDDGATSISCPLDGGNTYTPITPLANLVGQSTMGDWTMRINDAYDIDGGVFQGWGLELCFEDFEYTGLTLLNNDELICDENSVSFAMVVGADLAGPISFELTSGGTSFQISNIDGTYATGDTLMVEVTALAGAQAGTEQEIGLVALGENTNAFVTLRVKYQTTPSRQDPTAPMDGSIIQDDRVTLSWEGADNYDVINLHYFPTAMPELKVLVPDVLGGSFVLLEEPGIEFTWYIETINDCGVTESTRSKFTLMPNAVSEVEKLGFSVWPNPTSDRVVIRGDRLSELKSISMLDVLGQVRPIQVQVGVSQTQLEIDVQSIEPGSYFLRFQMPEGVITQKLLIQR